MLVSGSGCAELAEVEHDLVDRQRDDLAGLERQRLGALLRVEVGDGHVAHEHLLVGDAEDDVAALELVLVPQLLERGGQRGRLLHDAVDDDAGREVDAARRRGR